MKIVENENMVTKMARGLAIGGIFRIIGNKDKNIYCRVHHGNLVDRVFEDDIVVINLNCSSLGIVQKDTEVQLYDGVLNIEAKIEDENESEDESWG